jgi:hypothetical protein
MNTKTLRLVTLSAVASLAIAGSAQAKHGADDPVNHNAGDDSAQQVRHNGADDGANHDANDDRRVKKARHHKRHRHHHGRHHARHGADDPAGHR